MILEKEALKFYSCLEENEVLLIKEYRDNMEEEANIELKNIKEKVYQEYDIFKETKDIKTFNNFIKNVGKSKYFSLFDSNYFGVYSTIKTFKTYLKGNLMFLLPFIGLSIGTIISSVLLSTSILLLGFSITLLISFLEYYLKNDKEFKKMDQYLFENFETESFKKYFNYYMEEKSISLKNMIILKKILKEDVLKRIMLDKKGDIIYSDIEYEIRSIEKKYEERILKKNVDEIYNTL